MSRLTFRRLIVFVFVLSGCADGSVSSESALLPPAPIEPAQEAATANAVLLAWDDVESAFQYRIQVAADMAFSELVLEEVAKPYPHLPVRDLTKGETYFWRVRAESGESASTWSNPRSFHVDRLAYIPDRPRLTLPAYDQRNMDRRVRLEWEPVEGAYSYHLVVTLDEDMLLYQADLENLDTPYFDLQQLVFTYPYWWKVRALGPAGYSEWSSVSLFWVRPGQ